jgi:hypothetical protein
MDETLHRNGPPDLIEEETILKGVLDVVDEAQYRTDPAAAYVMIITTHRITFFNCRGGGLRGLFRVLSSDWKKRTLRSIRRGDLRPLLDKDHDPRRYWREDLQTILIDRGKRLTSKMEMVVEKENVVDTMSFTFPKIVFNDVQEILSAHYVGILQTVEGQR